MKAAFVFSPTIDALPNPKTFCVVFPTAIILPEVSAARFIVPLKSLTPRLANKPRFDSVKFIVASIAIESGSTFHL